MSGLRIHKSSRRGSTRKGLVEEALAGLTVIAAAYAVAASSFIRRRSQYVSNLEWLSRRGLTHGVFVVE